MPPFREGAIVVDRRLDGEALHELRDAGHGRRVNIVDASYDIPEGMLTLRFPGTSAEALLGVVRIIPVEDHSLVTMTPDHHLQGSESDDDIVWQAYNSFENVIEILEQEGLYELADVLPGIYRYDNVPGGSDPGFYTMASNPAERHLFIRTIDDLPFACASLVVGHSQRTE